MSVSTGVERRLTLPPAPDSARTARRFVGEVLAAARADEFADVAVLLTSELVTNGIVHAHTDLHVLVDATPRWVRVEVVDGDPRLPARREYDDEASTGRGLEMVELLADDFGVEPLDGDGKRVWFRLGAVPGVPEPHHTASSDSEPVTTTIELCGLPVTLYCAWQQHAEALLREATLLAFDGDADTHGDYPLAGRALGALADAASEVFVLREEEVDSVDAPLDLSSDAVPWFPILRDLLTRATAQSRAGQLLVPPSLPEIVALRDWICDEIARQSAGLRPMPWAGVDDDEVPAVPLAADTLAAIRAATAALVAADSGNRIVAVSATAAELLGWEPADLEGRRLVTIIPARLRNQHIAGFTRHLLDGSSRILGTEVPVPALRKDGSERPITLLLQARSDSAGRRLFVGTVTPREA